MIQLSGLMFFDVEKRFKHESSHNYHILTFK